jgi:hypothetical protein
MVNEASIRSKLTESGVDASQDRFWPAALPATDVKCPHSSGGPAAPALA